MADGSGARFRMRYSFASRLRAVRLAAAGMSIAEAARRQGASRSTVHSWRRRYSAEGAAGLHERSSRPHHSRAPRHCNMHSMVQWPVASTSTSIRPGAISNGL